MPVVRLLDKSHQRQAFDCGNAELNLFLRQFANQQSKRGLSKTYVLLESDESTQILGFYTLSLLSITPYEFELPPKGYSAKMQLPACLIGRLAVDKAAQGKGYAKLLFAHAVHNVKKLHQISGLSFVLVDLKTADLIPFYSQFGFRQTKADNPRMFLPVETLLST